MLGVTPEMAFFFYSFFKLSIFCQSDEKFDGVCQQLQSVPKWRKLKGRHLRVPSFDFSPQDKRETLANTPILKRRFSMVQAVTYQSDKQSVYFQGKLIVLENLTPVLSPEEKKKRKREIENNLYDIFSKYGDRFR